MTKHLIVLHGTSRAGKGTVAQIFRDELRHVSISAFADPAKYLAQEVFGFAGELLWGPSENRNRLLTHFKDESAWHLPEQVFDRKINSWCQNTLSVLPDKFEPMEKRLREAFATLKSNAIRNGGLIPRDFLIGMLENARDMEPTIWAKYGAQRAFRDLMNLSHLRAAVIEDGRTRVELEHVLSISKGVAINISRSEENSTKLTEKYEKEALDPEVVRLCKYKIINDGAVEDLTKQVRGLIDALNL